MDLPAELHRWVDGSESGLSGAGEVLVAKGPLVIMAYGLLSIDPSLRPDFWISSALGEMDADEAEEALQRWTGRA